MNHNLDLKFNIKAMLSDKEPKYKEYLFKQ